MWHTNTVEFSELEGKIISGVSVDRDNDDSITFYCADGSEYMMHHHQDCCEGVYIEDITGDIDNLIGEKIVSAVETSNSGESGDWESYTWTFYCIRTLKDTITIRWHGSSNGYYSESVDLCRIKEAEVLTVDNVQELKQQIEKLEEEIVSLREFKDSINSLLN